MAKKDGFEYMAQARELMREAVRCWADERGELERQVRELQRENERLQDRLRGLYIIGVNHRSDDLK
jgi:Arc/MetJ-type ribon-helix-helix transcriptional regulator